MATSCRFALQRLRSGAVKQSHPPPPSLWQGVRASAFAGFFFFFLNSIYTSISLPMILRGVFESLVFVMLVVFVLNSLSWRLEENPCRWLPRKIAVLRFCFHSLSTSEMPGVGTLAGERERVHGLLNFPARGGARARSSEHGVRFVRFPQRPRRGALGVLSPRGKFYERFRPAI